MTDLPMHASSRGRSQLSVCVEGASLTTGELLLRGIDVRYDYHC